MAEDEVYSACVDLEVRQYDEGERTLLNKETTLNSLVNFVVPLDLQNFYSFICYTYDAFSFKFS